MSTPKLLDASGKEKQPDLEERVKSLEQQVAFLTSAAMMSGTLITLLKHFFDKMPIATVQPKKIGEETTPPPEDPKK